MRTTRRNWLVRIAGRVALALLMTALPLLGLGPFFVPEAEAAGVLTVEILAGPNLVVDSNVGATSTRAPNAATVAARFCNTGDAPLTNVHGYIGSFAGGTPGVYPVRNSADAGFQAEHPLLANSGLYSFTHIGGGLGTADATRFMGSIPAGECRVQYWHLTYPQCENVGLAPEAPPCTLDPVWGASNDPDDDLWLSFDVWGTSNESNDNASWTMTMRNEISAMANKIEPNPDGEWFNTQGDTVEVGGVITSNGILYELGLVNQGFDNDGDYVPDYNAWLQPIGDAGFDPSCFRLIGTSTVLTVSRSAGNPDLILTVEDQLYFTHLPPDNTGVRGEVHYRFLAVDGPCTTDMSPYQEVASGFDNEKFNSDYGTGIPPVSSYAPEVTIDKTSNPNTIPLGGTTTYRIPFNNTDPDHDFGIGLSTGGSTPLVIEDTVPDGMVYVGTSATANLTYSPNTGVTYRWSTDSGATWQSGSSGPATNLASTAPDNLVILQWWLNDALPAGSTGSYAQFQATVPTTYTGPSFIENCAEAKLDSAMPFAEACAITMIQGNNNLGDFVWNDLDGDGVQDGGGEAGIVGITVNLYWDRDGDGVLDDSDPFIASTATNGSGIYGFSNLPDGNYIAVVDSEDGDLPVGYALTTAGSYAIPLDPTGSSSVGVSNLTADFGFGPVLGLVKNLTSENPAYEGDQVIYTLRVSNNRPGDGTGESAACTHEVWAGHYHPYQPSGGDVPVSDKGVWVNETYALGSPDSLMATLQFQSNADDLGLGAFDIGPQAGNITSVELVVYARELRDFAGTSQKDTLVIQPYFGNVGLTAQSYDATYFSQAAPADYVIVRDITSLRSWQWADFTSDQVELLIQGQKGNVAPNGIIGIDAVAYRITTDQSCGGPEDTLDPVPLSDTFDPTKLEFVSADPPESNVAGGTISWDNVGPLFAGQTRIITVVFTALEPPDTDVPPDGEADPTSHTNCGQVTDATFLDGTPANDASDCVTHDINPAGTIGDTVWNDNGLGGGTANDGIQNGGEVGIPNVTVYLCTATPCNAGTAIATAVTDANGEYLFTGVRDGSYVVQVDTATLPPGWSQTGDPDEAGACATCDNRGSTSINNNDGNSANDDDLTQDFGYRIPNTIYGNVWEDNDGDGLWETGENGFNSITVYLDNCGQDGICGNGDDGATVSTTTDLSGYYLFGSLPDGNYRVRVDTNTLPAGATWTNTADPEDDFNSQTNVIAASGGNLYGPYDFGYHRSGDFQLGDTVYVDWNADGDQDGGEEGIPNITVLLYQDDNGDGVIDPDTDGLIATTTTASDGTYAFTGLAAQSYIVVVDEADADFPAAHVQTQDPDEGGVCLTCDADGSATLGPNDDTVDFGYHPIGSASIGDTVWRDDNGNGVQEDGEPGIANITVTLYEDSDGDGVIDPEDAMVGTAVTDADGHYLFAGLPAGDYLVDVDTTDGDLPTDGDGHPYVLSTANDPHAVTLTAGQEYLDADFGFTTGGVIGDYVWQDNNADGDPDIDAGISGVVLNLYNDVNGNGVYDPATDTFVATDTTDGDGLYLFTGLPAGDYVVVVASGVPAGWSQTGDPDETGLCTTCNSQSGLYLYPGQHDYSRDFGYRPQGIIGDTLWIDADGDGSQDAGESGIANITVTLYEDVDGDGVYDPGEPLVQTTSTDSDGHYYFGGVSDGDYVVVVDTTDPDFPADLVQTYDKNGPLDDQSGVNITGGNTDLDQDFGYRYDFTGPNSADGYVFRDADQDGVYDTGESIYPNITVYLWSSTGQLLATTTTDASGYYVFPNLPDGNYAVSVDQYDPDLNLGDDGYATTATSYAPVSLDPDHLTLDPVIDRNDFGFYDPTPTAVRLSSFEAHARAGHILVSWETATEVDNLGFHLYRRQAGTDAYTRLNEQLIPSQAPGQGQGASYAFIDDDVQGGVTYQYVLVDLDASGVQTSHGPVVAQALYVIYFPLVGK